MRFGSTPRPLAGEVYDRLDALLRRMGVRLPPRTVPDPTYPRGQLLFQPPPPPNRHGRIHYLEERYGDTLDK